MNDEKKNVPVVRFNGFSDAWELCKLGETAESFEYGLNAPAKEFDGEHKYIRITDIDDRSHKFIQNKVTSPDINFENADKYKLQKGDILFARTGASVGKSYYYNESDGLVYYAGFLIRARIRPQYSHEFIFQNTLTDTYDKFIKITSQRSGQPGVNAEEYSNFKLMAPSTEEQQKIGAFLKHLDNTIALHQRKLNALKQMKKGFLQQMFPENKRNVPRVRFANFEEEWELRKLGDLATFFKGTGYTKNDLIENGSPIILYGRLYTKYETVINEVDTFVFMKDKSVISNGNEVIVPASGETSKDISRASVVVRKGIILGGDLNIIKADKLIDSIFLALTISNGSQQKEMVKRAQGKSVVHLHNSDLKQINLVYPKLKEQQKIGTFFKQLDKTIAFQQNKLNQIKTLKKAYLQNMFI